MFIYLDESGDLGFDFTKPKTSKTFTIRTPPEKMYEAAGLVVQHILSHIETYP